MPHALQSGMAMREFDDFTGIRWLAWDIRPENVHPITRYETYLQGFMDGWLVFESADGRERRRMHPVPFGWAELPDAELRQLLDRAERTVVDPRVRAGQMRDSPSPEIPSGESSATGPRPTLADTPVVRSFLYPGGRLWTVAEVPVQYLDPEGTRLGDARTVLRFSAGKRTLDLLAWPREWTTYDEAQLADLLYRAFPRRTLIRSADAPARRRSDQTSPK